MNIQTKHIRDLQPASYNPRRKLKPGQKRFAALARSMSEFGLVQPLVWNATTERLVGGHQRLEVLKAQGATEVEVVVVKLDEDKEKALNIALNNPLIGGEWDVPALERLVVELAELPDFDVTLTGFDATDVRNWRLTPEVVPGESEREQPTSIEVTLVVSRETWSHVERDIDQLVRRHQLEAHVREEALGVRRQALVKQKLFSPRRVAGGMRVGVGIRD